MRLSNRYCPDRNYWRASWQAIRVTTTAFIASRGAVALLPSLHSQQSNLVIAIDNSGSISSAELSEFITEIDALKSQVRADVTLLACDAALHAGFQLG